MEEEDVEEPEIGFASSFGGRTRPASVLLTLDF